MSDDPRFVILDGRAPLRLAGADTRTLLQGLVSNDVKRLTPTNALYAALLTPQGKYLHDFLLCEAADGILLDGEAARLDDLIRRLQFYRLRAQVEIAAMSDHAVVVIPGEPGLASLGLATTAGAARPLGTGIVFVDPRTPALGARAILARAEIDAVMAGLGIARGATADYERLRLGLCVPDGSRDLVVDKALPLENAFERLHGVDFAKGCYVGQEITARSKHRALLKRRLVALRVRGPLPEPGTPVHLGENEVGEMRSGLNDRGLALIRIDALTAAAGRPFTCNGAELTPDPDAPRA